MARATTQYVCSSCGYKSPKALGKCPECSSWNTFEEAELERKSSRGLGGMSSVGAYGGVKGGKVVSLREVSRSEMGRRSSGIGELDRVLGGGLVAGGVVLLGGEPGIGKSTLLLQVAHHIRNSSQESTVLYAAGEESLEQIRLRADRLGIDSDISFTRDTRVEAIGALIAEHKPALCIVDSIQTVQVGEDGNPGSPTQVRDGTSNLTRAAKEHGCAMVLVGHVTKEGTVAGPKVMEHIVDTTLFLESVGQYRLLRSAKNRFGAVGELGVFEMRESGLYAVENPSMAFLGERPVGMAGSVVAATIDGVRPLLLEVQALASKTPYPNPKRVVVGLDARRVDVVLAVLERRMELPLSSLDIYVNLAGGLRLNDPGLDLAIALAVYSAVVGKPLPPLAVVYGEVGLAGELRTVSGSMRRLEEAKRSGYSQIIAPMGSDVGSQKSGGVRTLEEALQLLRRSS